MGTYNAFYVKTHSKDKASVSAIREQFPAAKIETGKDFVGIVMNEVYEAPEAVLSGLSLRLKTDVIWLGFQSSVDAFVFHHWLEGSELRVLVYGMEQERTWERVSGKPEAWERDAFFSPKSLEWELESAGTDKKRAALERTWALAKVAVEKTIPSIDARASAHKIAAFYGFPGYRRTRKKLPAQSSGTPPTGAA